MNSNPLVVPMDVQALVVNNQTRKEENFQRWQMNYSTLESYASPMPEAFSGNTAINWSNTPGADGVYLRWNLPHALRTGKQDNLTGVTEYPLVPNRWLVLRYSGSLDAREAVAWVVESDFLDPNEGTSPYIDPSSTAVLKTTLIGRKVDIESWKMGAPSNLFLTAVGAGDITFSAYQPYNENVFSIHDPLDGVLGTTLSYLVVGWYSDPSKDILSTAVDEQSFLKLLKELDWEFEGQETEFCSRSIYQGLSYGIQWDKGGPNPPSKRPQGATLAVGNTSIDALTALIDHQADGDPTIDAQLLEAFQYNLLSLLDQPNGPDLLYQAIHKAWFGSQKGGHKWVIVKEPTDQRGTTDQAPYPASPIDWTDPNLVPSWLSKLNQDQDLYDDAWRKLQFSQWSLYRMWWTKGKFDNIGVNNQKLLQGKDPKFTDVSFQEELDPGHSGSTAQVAQQQSRKVTELLDGIPHGETQKELQQSINAFALANDLPKGYQLKRYSSEPFYKANDPVILIAGANAGDILADLNSLNCRFMSQLVTGLTYDSVGINTASMDGKVPTVELTNLPGEVGSLLDEFFFLDPNNATLIAAVALEDSSPATIAKLSAQMSAHKDEIGLLPDLQLETWEQPWSPLFLLWTVMYYPIAHEDKGNLNWTFDGQQYVLSDENLPLPDPKNYILSGTTLLTPQSSFNFKKRLDEYRKKHPKLDPEELDALENFITETDGWDFLSQTLDGFTQQLVCRDHESNVIPSGTNSTSGLIGSNNSIVPRLGDVPEPFKGWPDSSYQQFRSGQFCFQKLMVVDRFGQALQLSSANDYLQLKPVISPDMKPSKTVLAEEPYRFIQVGPRLLQPARLDFDFVSALDDSKPINLHSGVNPVCAWILPNHIDKSLACYDPEGGYLGDLRVISNTLAQQVVQWEFAPESSFANLVELSKALPHLGEMLTALINKGPEAFHNFYQVIDETLWVIDPLGSRDDQNLSVLVGRPLALTRCRLQYEIDGPPGSDPTWQHTFQSATPDFINYDFPIRLGELKLRNDGLIGYFFGSDYGQFNCVHLPTTGTLEPNSPPFNVQIGEGNFIDLSFEEEHVAYLTILVDPRASVHATTAILPASILGIPACFVEPALDAMKVILHLGPLLSGTTIQKDSDDQENSPTLLMPEPAEKNGVWSFLGKETNAWNKYSISSIDDRANFSNIAPVLRSGMLCLSSAKKKENETDTN